MSMLSVLSILLWQYIGRYNKKLFSGAAGLAVTMAAIGVLWYYGNHYAAIAATTGLPTWFLGAKASLSWLFMFLLAFPILLIGAAGCSIYRLYKYFSKKERPQPVVSTGISRRTFLKGTAAAIPVLALGTSTVGIFTGESDLATTVHRLTYASLPENLQGYRIGQLSDCHMGLFFGPQRLQESIDALVKEKVDLLVITGDLIDELTLLPECRDILKNSTGKFPDGAVFIYGNHEYYRGLEQITDMLETTDVRILRNENYKLRDRFYIAGADYSFARGDGAFQKQREEYVAKSLQDIPADAFVILLAHHSDFIDEGFAHQVELTLCGHTHGAQFALIGPIVQAIGFKYLRGMFQHNGSYAYVNRGTGHWLPFRLGCSREVSVFELGKG